MCPVPSCAHSSLHQSTQSTGILLVRSHVVGFSFYLFFSFLFLIFLFNIISLLHREEFHLMHHNSAHLPFLHIPHSPCSDLRKKKIKKKPKQNKACKQAKRKRKYKTKEQTKQTKSPLCFSTFPACPTLIHPGGIENCSVSHSVFFCPVTFPYKCSLQ